MEFLQSILNEAGADTARAFTIVPLFGGYFKSVKGVSEFSPQKIVLSVGKLNLTVRGENLCVGKFFQGDLFISGDIKGVELE